ncbi:unnamed protein product, partial [Mesorhabditis belari]|uniref:Uncharacterized protein n=1 Tax=Mesorhabditis belari TaxID=2138241 RepID=A0AAF3EU41_9BILA
MIQIRFLLLISVVSLSTGWFVNQCKGVKCGPWEYCNPCGVCECDLGFFRNTTGQCVTLWRCTMKKPQTTTTMTTKGSTTTTTTTAAASG